ncbi:NADPH-dependent oxidoreductase [Helicovermis profundi]|uniref:Oxygen-insensitive NADPH nitroreductase n=1 Tax=Helicovermis profundi TaxID=3065157 RepID=A0AAU9E4U2_9FIRM|nr:oxygen-insensitive NADPH nitroreductase [Clostridia bacterium S502]
MNNTIKSITNHRSIRSFTNQMIEEDKLSAILESAQAAPSSINGQQMSIIVIKDQTTKDKIAKLAGGQPWISSTPIFLLFLADYYRAKLAADKNDEELVISNNMEGTLVSSIDVGLAMGNSIVAAESLGLGTVCIGGIRMSPDEIIELLELPKYVYPMAGLCIGYPVEENIPDKKPRLPKEAVVHQEKYNSNINSYIDDYDKTISEYMKNRPNTQNIHDWSSSISSTYNKVYFPKVSRTLKEQGLKCE